MVHSYQSWPLGGFYPIQIHWADIHMHTFGSKGELSVVRADGTSECLLTLTPMTSPTKRHSCSDVR